MYFRGTSYNYYRRQQIKRDIDLINAAEKEAAYLGHRGNKFSDDQIRDYLKDKDPILLTWLNDPFPYHNNTVLCDMLWKLRKYGKLSEKQLAYAQKLMFWDNKRKTESAKRKPIPGSVKQVGGVVKTVKQKGSKWKFTVLDDRGFMVYSSVPKKIIMNDTPTVSPSDYVVFDVTTVFPSGDDNTFGFASRPCRPDTTDAGKKKFRLTLI